MAEYFVNPYNFVPLVGTCDKKEYKSYIPNGKSGYFECELSLLSPLFIPNTSQEEQEIQKDKLKHMEFYSYDDLNNQPAGKLSEPVIPGSELRGAIRSVFEAAFKGCLSSIDQSVVLGRRNNTAKKAGILRKEGDAWQIQPCKRYGILEGKCGGLREGEVQYFVLQETIIRGRKKKIVKLVPKDTKGCLTGYYHDAGEFELKYNQSIFSEIGSKSFLVDEDDITKLTAVVKQYNENKNVTYRYPEFDKDQTKEYLIYYNGIMDKKGKFHYYMTPACIGREVYSNNVTSILKRQGNYNPCDSETVCPACALFGTVNDNIAIGSRVRFEDARLSSDIRNWGECYMDQIYLKQLELPKPSAVEFYTEPIDINKKEINPQPIWNYDYKVEDEKITYIKNDIRLRGRKFYWHNFNRSNYCDYEKNKHELESGTVVRPLKVIDENKFKFRVYFENISPLELEQLAWAISPENVKEEPLALKIGYGKPLGLGSVEIKIKDIQVRNIDKSTGVMKWEARNLLHNSTIVKKIPKELCMMLDKKPLPGSRKITYPLTKDRFGMELPSFEWFVNNNESNKPRSAKKRNKYTNKTITSTNFKQVLPHVEEEKSNPNIAWLKVTTKQ